jgi:TonB family protein
MKSWGGVTLLVLVVGTIACIAEGQEAPSDAPAAQVETATPQEKVYDVQPDLVAPELIPMQWEVMQADTCKQVRDGLVPFTLLVDEGGVPSGISLVNPQGAPLEKMALRIADSDRFKPGTLKGEPVPVKRVAQISIEGCIATRTDEAGTKTEVFRLTAQPVQRFAAPALPTVPVPTPAVSPDEPLGPGIYRVGKGVSAPAVRNSVDPQYTNEARRKKIQGVCLIKLIVDVQGKPQNAQVVRPLGYGLDERAIAAVNKFKFKPAMKEGVPVPVMITVEVNFRLY